MKWNYIATSAALLLLIGTGYYWLNTSPETEKISNPTQEEKFAEVIDEKEIILDRPLTKSFSNNESNKEAAAQKKTKKSITSSFTKVEDAVVKTVASPFVLGIYYLDNIKNKGLDNCSLKGVKAEDDIKESKLLGKSFDVNSIERNNDQVFVHIDADSISSKSCARLSVFEGITKRDFNPIHIFVK